MNRSVWRYSHFALAVSSFLFLAVAALTGIVLAFEPVLERSEGYRVEGFEKVTLAQSLPLLREKYPGIQEIQVNDYGFVRIRYSDKAGDHEAYIHPLTGARLGGVEEDEGEEVFKWATNLHRSLFLHETGRAIMGITAFLLLLIALSGIGLLLQRQQGLRRFFAPVERGSFAQYYHVVFGRIALLFIVAIALSGAYLSTSRFLIRPQKPKVVVDDKTIREEPERKPAEFAVFRQTRLADVTSVQFPFSGFPEDYYTLKLKTGELCVNQLTGDVLARVEYDRAVGLAAFSLRWHTGRSGTVWALILAVTCGYILFFIYSGLAISWKRIGGRVRNHYKPEDCTTIILVGSENGSTYRFARSVYQQLLQHGEKVYIGGMDQYRAFPKAKQLLLMTSTYGDGEFPANARHFAERLQAHPQVQQVFFSIVGFGARAYAQFCQAAYDADALLGAQPWAQRLMDPVAVNDRSPQDFSGWLTEWTKRTGFTLVLSRELLAPVNKGLANFTVVAKSEADADGAFTVRLRQKSRRVASGDLLAIYPKTDHRERLYSIGIVEGVLQLSVKLHPQGLGSGYLHRLSTGSVVRGKVVRNRHFHFPRKASSVIMVANGTGIAPFLGMLSENAGKVPCYLYAGFRTRAAFALYEPFLAQQRAQGGLKDLKLALSREGEGLYVSTLLQRDAAVIRQQLSEGAVLMICGSLSMQKDVLRVLDAIYPHPGDATLAGYQARGQILTDCY